MYSFDFKTNLRRLNIDLFVDDSKRAEVAPGHFGASLYLRKFSHNGKNTSLLNTGQRQYLEALEQNDFICAVPLSWVPEHDLFNLESGKLLARGWRGILSILVSKKIVSLDKARIVFKCPGLGLDEYDKLGFADRLRWARGYRHKPEPRISWKDKLENYA